MRDLLNFENDGAALHAGAALSILSTLNDLCRSMPEGRAGLRLQGKDGFSDILRQSSPLQSIAASYLGESVQPVRSILFDKTGSMNWALGWHQDRTIAVVSRLDLPDFGPWSIKQGIQHVEPSFEIIERMVTLRVHLDDVPADNGPLLIARGSHRFGRLAEPEIDKAVRRSGIATSIAEQGDVWVYATPIIHASGAGNGTSRRVLQIDYSSDVLPGGLQWRGV